MKAVNLLPPEYRRGRSTRAGGERGGRGAHAVLGVLAALLAMVVLYALTTNQVNSKKSETAAAKREADQLEARAAALGAFGSFNQIKQTRMASVRQLAGSRFDWERLLRELAAILPRGSWLQEANTSVTGDPSASGSSSSSSSSGSSSSGSSPSGSGTTPGQPGATLKGCTPRQGDVAKLMVRLRQVYRVQDVQLTESTQGDRSSEPTVEDCGSFLEFNVAVTFSAPSAREAPPGRRRVPARLGGGS